MTECLLRRRDWEALFFKVLTKEDILVAFTRRAGRKPRLRIQAVQIVDADTSSSDRSVDDKCRTVCREGAGGLVASRLQSDARQSRLMRIEGREARERREDLKSKLVGRNVGSESEAGKAKVARRVQKL